MSNDKKNDLNDQANISDTNNARRKAVKQLLVGGGAVTAGQAMPSQWTKPVIDSLVLPAHGQMSVIAMLAGNVGAVVRDTQLIEEHEETIAQSLLEFFIPTAHAFEPANTSTSTTIYPTTTYFPPTTTTFFPTTPSPTTPSPTTPSPTTTSSVTTTTSSPTTTTQAVVVLQGACLTVMLTGTSGSYSLTTASAGTLAGTITISGSQITGTGEGGSTLTGTLSADNSSAMGMVSQGGTTYNYTLDDSDPGSCIPVEPNVA